MAFQQTFAYAIDFGSEQIDIASVFDACAFLQFVGCEDEIACGDVGLRNVALQAFEGFGGKGDLFVKDEDAAGEVWDELVGGHQSGVGI